MATQLPYAAHSACSSRERTRMLLFFNTLQEQLLTLQLEAQENFILLNEQLRYFYSLTFLLTNKVEMLAICLDADQEKLSGPVKHSLERISTLVADLQYQDIIRQKLEHIEKTNHKLCIAMEYTDSIAEWIPVLPQVVQLQAALLDFTDTEYQRAFRKMKGSLNSFKENTANVQEIGEAMLEWFFKREEEAQIAHQVNRITQEIIEQISVLLSDIAEPKGFSQLVKQINYQLKEFALELPFSTDSELDQSRQVLLELEGLYTMQSERLIYQRYIKIPLVKDTELMEEGEVELF